MKDTFNTVKTYAQEAFNSNDIVRTKNKSICDYDFRMDDVIYNPILSDKLKKYMNGMVVDYDAMRRDIYSEFYRLSDYYLHNHSFVFSPLYKEYINSLEECNYNMRKKQFLDLTLSDADELEQRRKRDISYYDSLISGLEQLQRDGKIKLDAATISFSAFVDERNRSPYINDVHSFYIPNDMIYATARTILDNVSGSGTFSKKIYDEMMVAVRQRLTDLSVMSVEQYRDYQIDMIKLSTFEREKIEADVKARPEQLGDTTLDMYKEPIKNSERKEELLAMREALVEKTKIPTSEQPGTGPKL